MWRRINLIPDSGIRFQLLRHSFSLDSGLTVLPIEVKSGKDFTSHKALDRFLADEEYNIPSGIVLDNKREVYTKNKVTNRPVCFVMCIERAEIPKGDYIF